MNPLAVSVVVPVKNEEKNLAACLDSVRDFSERIVVDSQSTDATAAVAQAAGATLLQFEWNGQFPKKRNWTLRTHPFQNEWILFLDADERATPQFVDELRRTLPSTPHSGFWLTYDNFFMGRKLRHGDKFRKIALVRRGRAEYERIDEAAWSKLDMEVHEHPIVQGSVGLIRSPIVHNDYKGLHAYIARHNEYSDWEARRTLEVLRAARDGEGAPLNVRQRVKYRLVQSIWAGPIYFAYSYFLKLGFLDGRAGLAFAMMKMAYFTQVACKIRELSESEAGGER
jgi:glycosyltransferase involved in cell wall biosynthesis